MLNVGTDLLIDETIEFFIVEMVHPTAAVMEMNCIKLNKLVFVELKGFLPTMYVCYVTWVHDRVLDTVVSFFL